MLEYMNMTGHVVMADYYAGVWLKNDERKAKGELPYSIIDLPWYFVMEVAGARNQYLKIQRYDMVTYRPYNKGWWVSMDYWRGSSRVSQRASNWRSMYADSLQFSLDAQQYALKEVFDRRVQLVQHDAEAAAMLKAHELSRNTVSRALMHADDNGYCNETAVALIGAGHKLPEGKITFEVKATIELNVKGSNDYYLLRYLYGKTRGIPTDWVGSDVTWEDKVREILIHSDRPVKLTNLTEATVKAVKMDVPMPVIRTRVDAMASVDL